MSDDLFAVVFTARLIDGVEPSVAQARVAQIFKVEPEKVAYLFTGKQVVVKKGLNEATAKKYQQVLLKAGLFCTLYNQSAAARKKAEAAAPPKPQAPQKQPQLKPVKSETDPSAGEPAHRSVVKEAPTTLGELGAAGVETHWDRLEEEHDDAPPNVDLSGIDLADKNQEIVVEAIEAPEIEVPDLEVDAPGTILIETEIVEDLEVDISDLQMDAPGVILVEHVEVEEPEIDISHLSAAQPPAHF